MNVKEPLIGTLSVKQSISASVPVQLSISPDAATEGGSVSPSFFGGYFLFDRDRVGQSGAFDEKAEALAITFFRHPGETISERYFDLSSSDATRFAPDAELLSLTDFVAYVGSVSGTSALVLPSIKYMRALLDGSMSAAEVRAEFRTFFEALKSDDFGDHRVFTHFELGNEHHAHRADDWDAAAAYGEYATLVAPLIRETFGNTVKISVQAGAGKGENGTILKAFGDRDDLVDVVSFHEYPWREASIDDRRAEKMTIIERWFETGLAEEEYLSEWSISNQYKRSDGERIGSDEIDDGMARAVAMIELAVEDIDAGVDAASVWPIQQKTCGDLAGDEGELSGPGRQKLSANNLTQTGEAFRLMSEAQIGKRIVDIGNEVAIGGGAVFTHAFQDEREFVLCVSASNVEIEGAGFEFVVNLPAAVGPGSHLELTVDGDPERADGRQVLSTASLEDGGQSVRVWIENSYGINRFIFERPDNLEVKGTSSNDVLIGGDRSEIFNALGGDDVVRCGLGDNMAFGDAGADKLRGGGEDLLIGRAASDNLAGGAGQDTLLGGAGNDVLRGQTGDDVIKSGGGEDRLLGNGGDDKLSGGGRNDLIRDGRGEDSKYGGGGDDRIDGGHGGDMLFGGAGDDAIIANSGDDVSGDLGADTFILRPASAGVTIHEFEVGIDEIDFRGADMFDFTATDNADGAIILAGETELALVGVFTSDIDEVDFIF